MFSVKKLNDIYIAKEVGNLSIPEHLSQVNLCLDTIQNLYMWKNHHIQLKETVVNAIIKKEEDDFFSSFFSGSDNSGGIKSPNVFLTPTKAKKNNEQ